MKYLHCLVLGLLFVLGACRTNEVAAETEGARPEVRYYVIADT